MALKSKRDPDTLLRVVLWADAPKLTFMLSADMRSTSPMLSILNPFRSALPLTCILSRRHSFRSARVNRSRVSDVTLPSRFISRRYCVMEPSLASDRSPLTSATTLGAPVGSVTTACTRRSVTPSRMFRRGMSRVEASGWSAS